MEVDWGEGVSRGASDSRVGGEEGGTGGSRLGEGEEPVEIDWRWGRKEWKQREIDWQARVKRVEPVDI